MPQIRDWQGMKEMMAHLLMESTGEGVEAWNERIKQEAFNDENSLREWLEERGVTGYAQSLLVMEQFGYPDYLVATGDELIAPPIGKICAPPNPSPFIYVLS